MSTASRRSADRATLTWDGSAGPGGATAQCSPGMSTLDELLADPMVQQLVCRDRTDQMAVRRLWEHVAASRPAWAPSPRNRPAMAQAVRESSACPASRSCAQCAVLLKLEQREFLNQVTLAHVLDVTPMTFVRLLDRLETAGLVSRLPDPHDRRAYLLAPTAKTQPLIACIHDIIRMIQSEAWLGLSDTGSAARAALLDTVKSLGLHEPAATR